LTLAAYPLEDGILLQSIRDQFRADNAGSVTAAGLFAVNTGLPLEFRRATAHALAAIHTLSAVPYLAALLDDQDSELQIEAVGGIGSFANGLPSQTSANTASLAYLQFAPNAPFRTTETVAKFRHGATGNSAKPGLIRELLEAVVVATTE
jgi:hypothetical protein